MFYNHNVMCVHSIHTCMFASYNNIQGVVCMCAYMLCIYTCMIDICIPGCMHSCIHTTCNVHINIIFTFIGYSHSFFIACIHAYICACTMNVCLAICIRTVHQAGLLYAYITIDYTIMLYQNILYVKVQNIESIGESMCQILS